MFGVSRRLVQFRWYPEKLEQNLKSREERGGTAIYYDKEEHRKSVAKHRAYKKELIKLGKI